MKTKPKKHQTFDSVKRICLSKNRILFYLIVALLFVILNLFFIPGLFSSGNDLFDANDTPIILIAFTLIGFLILISILTPFWLKKKSTEIMDEDELRLSLLVKILLSWFPFGCYIIAQMIVLGFCEKISPYFNMSFVVILLTGIALCVLVFVWIIICAFLYLATRHVGWYFIGLLALNFAPIVISRGCYEIYNANPLMNNESWNPLNFNLFSASAALFGYPIILLLVLGIIIGIFIYLWRRNKNHSIINPTIISFIYKITVIFLISLSGAFVISNNLTGNNQIICFLVVALSLAILLAFVTLRSSKKFLCMGINVFLVIIFSILIFGVMPAKVQKESLVLPQKEEVESVQISLDSIETFEVDKHFVDCLNVHESLLGLFEDGYLPDETEKPYKEPECIADLWEDATFRYKLKDGKYFHREYRDLKDSAFDEFYIQLMKSDMYAYSLQKIKPDNPQMRYFYYGDDNGKWCELPESCIVELLNTYCDELKMADKSAFYEDYETIRLTGVYDYRDRIIYIPLSFTDTRNLATQYLNTYAVTY